MANRGMNVSVNGVTRTLASFAGAKHKVKNLPSYVVGASAEYAAYVEFGTTSNRAQPYLFPAARYVMRTEFDSLASSARSVGDLIRRVALAIEREAKKRAPVDTGNLRSSIQAVKL